MIFKTEIENIIDKQVKACIHCGMCLPACPTYVVTGNEGNSPRGRIYLINDLIKKAEDFSSESVEQTVEYLDNCLSCYACETVCPSDVQYASILDYARNDLSATRYSDGIDAFLRSLVFRFVLPNRTILNFFREIIKKTSWLLSVLSFISPSLKKLKKLEPKFDTDYEAIKTNHIYHSDVYLKDINLETRIISLPLGCVMDTVYNSVHWDTIYVLNQFGYHVYIPNTGCCGSLATHSGEKKLGLEQLQTTLKQFREDKYPVVINSAGCGAFIKEHLRDFDPASKIGNTDFLDDSNYRTSNPEIMDLITALLDAPYNPLENSSLDESKKISISYHPACHLNHRQGVAYDYLDLIKQMKSITVKELRDADLCCGSAGFYNLIKTDMADLIGKEKARNVEDTGAKILVTANPGCMSQIQAHLPDDYRVVHPVTLVADYLRS